MLDIEAYKTPKTAWLQPFGIVNVTVGTFGEKLKASRMSHSRMTPKRS